MKASTPYSRMSLVEQESMCEGLYRAAELGLLPSMRMLLQQGVPPDVVLKRASAAGRLLCRAVLCFAVL